MRTMNENTERLAGCGPEQVLESSAGPQHPLSVALLISRPAGPGAEGPGDSPAGLRWSCLADPTPPSSLCSPWGRCRNLEKTDGGSGLPPPSPLTEPLLAMPLSGSRMAPRRRRQGRGGGSQLHRSGCSLPWRLCLRRKGRRRRSSSPKARGKERRGCYSRCGWGDT